MTAVKDTRNKRTKSIAKLQRNQEKRTKWEQDNQKRNEEKRNRNQRRCMEPGKRQKRTKSAAESHGNRHNQL